MKRNRISKTIRLYKTHDLDLISFLDTHNMDFRKAVYCSLTAFAKGEVFVIKIPPRLENPKPLRRKYEFRLILNPETDQAVIDMIDGITDGYKNNFIKNILRMYLCTPISEEFLKDRSKIGEFEEKFQMFKIGKRVADAARVKNMKTGRAAKYPEDRLTDIFDEQEVQSTASKRKKNAVSRKPQNAAKKETQAEPGSVCYRQEYPVESDTDPVMLNSEVMDGKTVEDEDITDLFSSLIMS